MRRTRERLPRALGLTTLALLPGLCLAAEGRIPIPFTSPPVTPVMITAPGKYILTRPLTSTGLGPVISVAVPGPAVLTEVDIDLNGFTLDGTPDPASPVISVVGVAGTNTAVSIRNGAMQGGSIGISAAPGTGNLLKVVIERVLVSGPPVAISITDAANSVVKDSIVVNAGGIVIQSGARFFQATIEDNLVQTSTEGIVVIAPAAAPAAVAIRNNRLELINGGDAIFLQSCRGSLVIENTIRNVTRETGIRLVGTDGTKLIDNAVNQTFKNGILLDVSSDDNLILENVVTGALGSGLHVQGDRNHIEGNLLNTNARGLTLDLAVGAVNNIYRRNTARGNTGAVACPGPFCSADFCGFLAASNHTQGDNWLPATAAAPPPCEK